jgi:ribosomal protein S19
MRSCWKGKFSFKNILLSRGKELGLRRGYIVNEDIGLKFRVENGKKTGFVVAKDSMVGLKFGSFFFTKSLGSAIHLKKKKKERKK